MIPVYKYMQNKQYKQQENAGRGSEKGRVYMWKVTNVKFMYQFNL